MDAVCIALASVSILQAANATAIGISEVIRGIRVCNNDPRTESTATGDSPSSLQMGDSTASALKEILRGWERCETYTRVETIAVRELQQQLVVLCATLAGAISAFTAHNYDTNLTIRLHEFCDGVKSAPGGMDATAWRVATIACNENPAEDAQSFDLNAVSAAHTFAL